MPAQLLTIVSVAREKRIQCQNPGCGHGVYAAIHVVEDEGQLLVMGSTCYAKRYGGAEALGKPSYGYSGGLLTAEQRDVLANNTALLIAQLKREHERVKAEAAAKLKALKERLQPGVIARPISAPAAAPNPRHPWPWQHRTNTSVAVLWSPSDQCWLRVMHQDGTHKLVPWPAVEGWQTALPDFCGPADIAMGYYSLPNVVSALKGLQELGFSTPQVTRWPQVLSLLPPQN